MAEIRSGDIYYYILEPEPERTARGTEGTDGTDGADGSEEEKEEILVRAETTYDLDDIYTELSVITSKLYTMTGVNKDVEARLQHVELYLSVEVGLLSFILGCIMGYLFLGRILT